MPASRRIAAAGFAAALDARPGPSARDLTSDRRGDLHAAGRGGIPRRPAGSSASDRGCRARRVAPRVAHHDTGKAPALRLPAEPAGSLGLPSSRVASIGAPCAVGDERRRARLRRPARCRSLRDALAAYLGRVRGVVADPAHIVVTAGFTQGLNVVLRTLASRGAARAALESPGNTEYIRIVERAGLEPVPIEIDADGLRTHALAGSGADVVVVSPAHQHPTGVVLSGERRTELLRWLRDQDAIAVEDDYDAEYRYERAPVGALQGLAPDLVVYAGSVSKTLAPALRLGWLVVPPGSSTN